ncbi:hypothetical protein CI109_105480 [Kwoniella shandongensis]|uniref:Uncharacterized protein n=1 Tax=Kwoniella shandongensis TaxID=1734106 RepID=A0A5M6C2F8_9TREE|nr:uncharacterized protein CI109_002201 [Kwoniella shandongensis]KAA5529308.1 hypothetical protein CI109_002201 [Kwoniella shandongensis]
MPIGPSLPPHLAHLAASRSPSPPGPSLGPPGPAAEEEDEDDYVPALPPHLAAARGNKGAAPSLGPSIGPSAPTVGPSIGPSIPTVGPTLPPTTAGPSRPPPSYLNQYDDDSDDDVIGPRPVPTAGGEEEAGSAIREFMEREERRRKDAEEASKPQVRKREEWMLVPPTSGVLSNVDPLRKRPTTFSKSTAEPSDIDNTLWTETPAEKAQRIADEVAGVKRKKDKAGERIVSYEEEEDERRKRRRDREILQGVEKHTASQRGPSLLDKHAAKLSQKKKEGKEDEAPGIWDHDRDMGITGRLLSEQERKAKIKDARGLGDRFGHGKSGAFSM